ncbi:hypothetical protein MtrunA17_Chr5g0423631 [Medicago truncatula]|uniref:Transmembrane protein n=1 Tax=Medicago truncatula TaxID=3880 RepID=A0A396HRC5_MEDTR|nr:hypothetical protein MtrunA17_Chr5g0423631 [Medicago truncatula]
MSFVLKIFLVQMIFVKDVLYFQTCLSDDQRGEIEILREKKDMNLLPIFIIISYT